MPTVVAPDPGRAQGDDPIVPNNQQHGGGVTAC